MLVTNLFKRGLLFSPEPGAGGNPPAPAAPPPAPAEPPKPDDAAGKDHKGGDAGGDDKKFTQADVNAIVKERLERERKKAESEAQKLREEAEAEALKKQGDFQKLAEKHEARVKELEAEQATLKATSEQADKYKAALEKYAEAETKDLPEHIRALLSKMDVAERLEYIAANREALTGAKPPAKPVPPTPPANGDPSEAEKEEARRATARQTRNRF